MLTRHADKDHPKDRFSPYMVVSVDKGLMSGHTDIWGVAFSRFVESFVAARFRTRDGV